MTTAKKAHRHVSIYVNGALFKDTILPATAEKFGADWLAGLWVDHCKNKPDHEVRVSDACVCCRKKVEAQ